MTQKVIITNQSALQDLYKENYNQVIDAVNQLIEADKNKGIESSLVFIDDKDQMAQFDGLSVANTADEEGCKKTVDAIYTKTKPDYILLLGGPDIVPHQQLNNPIKREKILVRISFPAIPVDIGQVPSDLPYACNAAYSKKVKDFIAPTRVVGRLAGVTGSSDTSCLVNSIQAAIESKPVEKKEYEDYFSIATRNPKPEIAPTSLDVLFGNHNVLKMSPPTMFSELTKDELAKKSHFVVCHGVPNFPFWMGEETLKYWKKVGKERGDDRFVISIEPGNIKDVIPEQTLAAAINCFGGQLYNPTVASEKYIKEMEGKLNKIKVAPEEFRQMGMCNTYMQNKAIAFCGSTSLAYEPGIIQHFFDNVLCGASTGRAFLQARQAYVLQNPKMSHINLKTIAEYILLGDPSAHPIIKQEQDSFMDKLVGSLKTGADTSKTKDRRKALEEHATSLAENTLTAEHDESLQPSEKVAKKIKKLIADSDLQEAKVESHTYKHSTDASKDDTDGILHVVSGYTYDKEHDLFPKIVKHLVYEKDGDALDKDIDTVQSM